MFYYPSIVLIKFDAIISNVVNQRKDWGAFKGIIGWYSLAQSIDSFVGKKAACNSRNLSLTGEKNLQQQYLFKPKTQSTDSVIQRRRIMVRKAMNKTCSLFTE